DMFWLYMRDAEFFEQTLDSSSESHEYKDILKGLIPRDWEFGRHEIWLWATPRDVSLPPQGFKIHVSATSMTAADALRKVAPVCVSHGAPFKAIADPMVVEMMTSKNCGRGGSGKFMTIYPSNED